MSFLPLHWRHIITHYKDNVVAKVEREIPMKLSRVFTSSVLMAGLGSAISSVAMANIISHRAVYDLTMHKVSSSAQIESIEGQTRYTLKRGCDGWESNEDYVVSFGFGQDSVTNFASSYNTWESFSGDSFSFQVTENSTLDGETQYDGFANIGHGIAEAFYSTSGDDLRTLPQDTLFPVQHMEVLMQKAKTGETVHQTTLFLGGEEDDSLYFVNSVMGKRKASTPPAVMGKLGENGYWPITIAYYDPEAKTLEPEYEINFKVQENGVIPSYIVNYSDFSMSATLRSVESITDPKC